MIKSTIIARKNDGMILCEFSEEQQNKNFCYARNQTSELIKNISNNNSSINIDSQFYAVHFKLKDNAIFLVIADQNYPQKLAYEFLEIIINLFNDFLNKNNIHLENFSDNSYFLNFQKIIKNQMIDFNNNQQNNVEKLNREISDVHQIMAENISLIMDREKSINIINSLSETIKDDSGKFKKLAYETKIKMILSRYAMLISIITIIFLIILFKIYF